MNPEPFRQPRGDFFTGCADGRIAASPRRKQDRIAGMDAGCRLFGHFRKAIQNVRLYPDRIFQGDGHAGIFLLQAGKNLRNIPFHVSGRQKKEGNNGDGSCPSLDAFFKAFFNRRRAEFEKTCFLNGGGYFFHDASYKCFCFSNSFFSSGAVGDIQNSLHGY